VFDLSSEVLDKVTDQRQKPRTPTALILKSTLAMFWARLGSLLFHPPRRLDLLTQAFFFRSHPLG